MRGRGYNGGVEECKENITLIWWGWSGSKGRERRGESVMKGSDAVRLRAKGLEGVMMKELEGEGWGHTRQFRCWGIAS